MTVLVRMAVFVRMTVFVFVRMAVLVRMAVFVFLVLVMMMVGAVVMVVLRVMTMAMREETIRAHELTSRLTESIRPTAIAAPKPLSMFTTVMPEAQLVSIPNSAVKPDSAVP